MQMLMQCTQTQSQKQIHYVDTQDEIYSLFSERRIISITGHAGIGKTLSCRKLISLPSARMKLID